MDLPTDDPEPSLTLLAQLSELSPSYLIVNLVAFILLVVASSLVSGSEVAFFSLSSNDLADLENSKTKVNKAILSLLDRKRQLLATILILNNMVNIAIVTLSTFFTWSLVGSKTTEGKIVVILSAVVTFIILFFGEVVPKNFANQHNVRFAQTTARALFAFEKIFSPLSSLLISVTNIIEKNVEKKGHNITVDELNQALEITTGDDTTDEEKGILKGIVNFSTLSVKQVMKSRIDRKSVV